MQFLGTNNNSTTTVNGPFPGLPGWAGTRKVKTILILLKQETVSGSGISWAICKSAPRSRQITTPAPHHLVFTGRTPFLSSNQQRQSTEGKILGTKCTKIVFDWGSTPDTIGGAAMISTAHLGKVWLPFLPMTQRLIKTTGWSAKWPQNGSCHHVHTVQQTTAPFVVSTHRPGWLGSRVVSVLDSGAEGPGFKSQSRRCRVTVLGKLFTPIVPLFTKQQNW